ncbi:hypothetical protein FS935_19880 [Metabacillus litoralis]|uniref:Uncharacterized protein n=1 Tax=Metabacillus litoralis TaxID=152268 RepID=A0A5C6VLV7_9BACI|nr:hypothetical protein [Metabacillus litoralis]TXC85764.1 hypothetical protein FS935_19880 [Metabacillus litoralis]
MESKIKKLLLLNVLFYLNNLILILLTINFGLKGFIALWFFSPFVFVLFTTSILESTKGRLLGYLRKIAILDFLLRCIVVVINFLVISELIFLPLYYLIVIGIIFMCVNVYLELRISKHLHLLDDQNENIDQEVLTKREIDDLCDDFASNQSILKFKSPGEKEEIRNIYFSTFSVGYSYVLIILLIGGGIFGFEFLGEKYRLLILFIAFLLLGIYFYLTNKKFALFFKDRHQRKKINLRDNLTFIIGLSIIYILQGYVHIGTGTFNFLGIFLATMFLIPTIKTNHLIRDEFHKMNKKYIDK